MAPFKSAESTRRRLNRQTNLPRVRRVRQPSSSYIAQHLARLVGELVRVHVAGARTFVGALITVDCQAHLIHIEQLADASPVWIAIDAVGAIEPARVGEMWALVEPEAAA